jgi:hypothetical protein
MENIFLAPSFYAHVINGLLILFLAFYLLQHFNFIKNLDTFKKILILLLLAIVIGIHSLSHLGLEYVYNFNPLLRL